MHIRLVKSDKKRFLDLLLLADEQESMIDRYIERGDLFVMEEKGEAKAVAVVTREGQGVYELKNLAVAPACQRKGYGRMMVEHVWHYYADCHTLLVGTGDSPLTLPFYRSCGFTYSHTLPDFFTRHYDHPIIEGGILLKDMIYLKRKDKTPSGTVQSLLQIRSHKRPWRFKKTDKPPQMPLLYSLAPFCVFLSYFT